MQTSNPLATARNARSPDRHFSDRTPSGINVASAQSDTVLFEDSAMNGAFLYCATLRGMRCKGANLKGASFIGARLEDVTFVPASVTGAVCAAADLERTDLEPALHCSTRTPRDAVDNPDCDGPFIKNIRLSNGSPDRTLTPAQQSDARVSQVRTPTTRRSPHLLTRPRPARSPRPAGSLPVPRGSGCWRPARDSPCLPPRSCRQARHRCRPTRCAPTGHGRARSRY